MRTDWIRVAKDKYPEDCQLVIALEFDEDAVHGGNVYGCVYQGGEKGTWLSSDGDILEAVTHWVPRPQFKFEEFDSRPSGRISATPLRSTK
jgi:hypothetical protein